MTNHIIPVSRQLCTETFTFAEHVQYARDNHLTDYSGGSDWAPWGAYRDQDIPVHPSAPFKITSAGWNDKARPTFGYGVCIRGDCGDGDVVVLGHLQDGSLGYSVGQTVTPADTIGLMSWTGNVRPQGPLGKHTHWGVKRNGVYINPMSVLGQVITAPPVEPPVVTPPITGKLVRVVEDMAPALRTSPHVAENTLILRSTFDKRQFAFVQEVSGDGIKWAEVICYIAAEFVEPVA